MSFFGDIFPTAPELLVSATDQNFADLLGITDRLFNEETKQRALDDPEAYQRMRVSLLKNIKVKANDKFGKILAGDEDALLDLGIDVKINYGDQTGDAFWKSVPASAKRQIAAEYVKGQMGVSERILNRLFPASFKDIANKAEKAILLGNALANAGNKRRGPPPPQIVSQGE